MDLSKNALCELFNKYDVLDLGDSDPLDEDEYEMEVENFIEFIKSKPKDFSEFKEGLKKVFMEQSLICEEYADNTMKDICADLLNTCNKLGTVCGMNNDKFKKLSDELYELVYKH